jgi:hypothetical protein
MPNYRQVNWCLFTVLSYLFPRAFVPDSLARQIVAARLPSCRDGEIEVCLLLSERSAAEAGFRPCLRCRRECSPGTLAWVGKTQFRERCG